jgi:hypothetical protein
VKTNEFTGNLLLDPVVVMGAWGLCGGGVGTLAVRKRFYFIDFVCHHRDQNP